MKLCMALFVCVAVLTAWFFSAGKNNATSERCAIKEIAISS